MRAGMKTAGLGSSVLSHYHNDLTREVILYVRNGWHTRQASMAGPPASTVREFCKFLPYGQEDPAFRPNILAEVMVMNECVKIVHMLLCFAGISGDMSTFHFESAFVHVTFQV
jgi:hypothetical protein